MLKPSRPLSIGLGVAGVTIFFITSMMIRSAGLNSGSTGQGQELLGWGNIAMHVTGLILFGTATGYLFRAKHRFFGVLTGIVVFGTALMSTKNLVDFGLAERTSLVKARAAQAKAQEERRQAQLSSAKKKQDDYTNMVKEQLRWNQGTAKDVDGRKGRNDMIEANTKLIQDFGKADTASAAVPDIKVDTEVILRPDGGVELLSKATGLDKDFIELISSMYQMIMLIVMEAIIWPLAAFFWPQKGEALALATAVATTLAPPQALKPIGGSSRETKLLPAPKAKSKPVTIRTEPSAAWRQLLDQVDFPPAGARHQGPLRPKDKRSHVALRFVTWLQAYNEVGDYRTDQLDALYEDFYTADHRSPWGVGIVKSELEAFRKRIASKWQGNGTTMWTIERVTPEKMAPLLQKAGLTTVQEAPADPLAHEPEVEEVEDSTRNVIMANFWPRRTSTLPN